jgi:hypothetical protein
MFQTKMLVGASLSNLSNLSTSTMQEGTSPLNPPSKGGNLRGGVI